MVSKEQDSGAYLPLVKSHDEDADSPARAPSNRSPSQPASARRGPSEAYVSELGDAEQDSGYRRKYSTGRNSYIDSEADRISWCVIVPKPGSKAARYVDTWDGFMMIVLVLAGYTIPYSLSMPSVLPVLGFWFNRFLDLVFTSDMCLTFVLAFPKNPRGFSKVRYETSLYRIARRYCGIPFSHRGEGGWFWLDFVTVFPGWVEMCGFTTSKSILNAAHMIRFFRIFRVMRLVRLAKLMDEVRVRFGVSYWTTDLTKFLFIVTLVAHWAACMWVTVEGKVTDSVMPLTAEVEESWLSALIAAKGDPCYPNARSDPVCVYSIAVYWAIMTLTGIGYGDITPVNHLEYVVCAFFMITAAFVWTYIVASVVSVLSSFNPHEALFKQRIDELNDMMQNHSLPHSLRIELRRFMLESRHIESVRGQKHLLDNNISAGLQGKVAEENPATEIMKTKVFWAKDLDQVCLLACVSNLHPFIYGAHEHVPIYERMIIMQAGLAAVSGGTIAGGDVYGIRSVLLETTHLIEEYSPYTLSFVDILAFEKDDLRQICCKFPQMDVRIRRAQIRTATWRAFVLCAQKRMEEVRKRNGSEADTSKPKDFLTVRRANSQIHRSFGRFKAEMQAWSIQSGGGSQIWS